MMLEDGWQAAADLMLNWLNTKGFYPLLADKKYAILQVKRGEFAFTSILSSSFISSRKVIPMDLQYLSKTLHWKHNLIQPNSTHYSRRGRFIVPTADLSAFGKPTKSPVVLILTVPSLKYLLLKITSVPSPKTSIIQKHMSQLSQVPNLPSGNKPCTYEILVGKEAPNVRSCAIYRALDMNGHAQPGAMMDLNEQHRSCHSGPSHIILSAAKDLYAHNNTTFPTLPVKNHIRSSSALFLNGKPPCLKSQTLQTIANLVHFIFWHQESPWLVGAELASALGDVGGMARHCTLLNLMSQMSQPKHSTPHGSMPHLPNYPTYHKISCPNCPKAQTNQNIAKSPVPSPKLLFHNNLSHIAGPPCGGAVIPYVVARGCGDGMWGPCGCHGMLGRMSGSCGRQESLS